MQIIALGLLAVAVLATPYDGYQSALKQGDQSHVDNGRFPFSAFSLLGFSLTMIKVHHAPGSSDNTKVGVHVFVENNPDAIGAMCPGLWGKQSLLL